MEIFFYTMIFIIGTVFGSFFTLAVYRIPLKKDITHERSFCPTCNHKLGFWDMIPVWSYIFAGGKCRYCGEKIRIRYLILEVLSGVVFVLECLALNMKFPYLEMSKIIVFISFVFMYITIVLISGIDKEYRKIHLGVLLFGLIMQGIYILYLYVMNGISMYRYGIYLAIILFLCILDIISVKKIGESKYIIQILLFITYIGSCIGTELLLLSVIISIILMIMYYIFLIVKQNFNDTSDILKENKLPKIRIGFFIGISTVLVSIIETFITYM